MFSLGNGNCYNSWNKGNPGNLLNLLLLKKNTDKPIPIDNPNPVFVIILAIALSHF